jgi:translation initiation factor 1
MTRLFAGTPFDRPPTCERCGKLVEECACPPPKPERTPTEQQRAKIAGVKIAPVKIAVEKRKKGKVVTALRGLTGREAEVSELLSHLKSVCGAGGTFKDGVLEIQGEHADRVRDALLKRGYRVQAK